MSRNFNAATEEEILQGKASDVYFSRSLKGMSRSHRDPEVVAEFTVSGPLDPWIMLSGLDEVVNILKGKEVRLFSIPEGTIFPPRDDSGIPVPVMRMEGKYSSFGILETAILGFICQSSGISTYSARVRRELGSVPFYSFGIRRMHPAISPMIDRASYIGGADGVSGIIGGEITGTTPVGTMPHSLSIIYGDEEAWKMVSPVDGGRTVLIDTFMDEKFAAIRAAELLKDLKMVRIDTPASRRGKLDSIIREVKWELALRGHGDVRIMVSGGLKLENLSALVKAGADAFGIGTSIASARPYDFSMDIVEVEGNPVTKRGKFSGRKLPMRCERCNRWKVVREFSGDLRCECGESMKNVFTKYIESGELVSPYPNVAEIRSLAQSELSRHPMSDQEKWQQ